MGECYLFGFFRHEEGDLSIPDVLWAGGFAEGRAWAQARLRHLEKSSRAAGRPAPCQCLIRDWAGVAILTIEIVINSD